MPHLQKFKKMAAKNSGPGINHDERFRQQFRKTRLCAFWEQGRCEKGSGCGFAHGETEIQAVPDLTKTSVCPRWVKFSCRKSSEECPFAHGPHELRATEAYLAKPKVRDPNNPDDEDDDESPEQPEGQGAGEAGTRGAELASSLPSVQSLPSEERPSLRPPGTFAATKGLAAPLSTPPPAPLSPRQLARFQLQHLEAQGYRAMHSQALYHQQTVPGMADLYEEWGGVAATGYPPLYLPPPPPPLLEAAAPFRDAGARAPPPPAAGVFLSSLPPYLHGVEPVHPIRTRSDEPAKIPVPPAVGGAQDLKGTTAPGLQLRRIHEGLPPRRHGEHEAGTGLLWAPGLRWGP